MSASQLTLQSLRKRKRPMPCHCAFHAVRWAQDVPLGTAILILAGEIR